MLLAGLVGTVQLLRMRMKKWKNYYTLKQQTFWYSLFGSSLNCFEGAIENLYQGNPGGPRIILAIVVQIFTIWGTCLKDDDPRIIVSFENNEGCKDSD